MLSFLQEKYAKQESAVLDTSKNTESNARSSVSHEKISENCRIETFSSGENYNFLTSKAYSLFNCGIGDENDKSSFILS